MSGHTKENANGRGSTQVAKHAELCTNLRSVPYSDAQVRCIAFRAAKERLGLSNGQIARRCNVPKSTVRRWADGGRIPADVINDLGEFGLEYLAFIIVNELTLQDAA